MELMFITNEPESAKIAEDCGVDIIFVDLEINGKHERQGHLDTHIANHKIEDVGGIKRILETSKVLTRINPIYEKTKIEIEECIKQGSDIIMLPMFKEKNEVEEFIDLVNGRAETCLLLETPQALVRINEIVEIMGIDRIHIGLNDLHLGMGLDFMFELLSGGIVEYLARIIMEKGIKFGFGGIARIGEGNIPAECILAEHYRLGSEMVILSRAFRKDVNSVNTRLEVEKIRNYEMFLKNQNNMFFESNREKLTTLIRKHTLEMEEGDAKCFIKNILKEE